jgi:hypothetical protein
MEFLDIHLEKSQHFPGPRHIVFWKLNVNNLYGCHWINNDGILNRYELIGCDFRSFIGKHEKEWRYHSYMGGQKM